MISLGLDPSLTGFGWCVHNASAVGKKRVVARGRWATPAKQLFITRYMALREHVKVLLDKYPEVEIVGVESPPFGELWSEGLYGLFLYVNEAIYTRRKDVVFFDPATVKLLAKGDPKRTGKMFKSDMVAAAKADTDGATVKWNHNEADAYIIGKSAARFWSFLSGAIQVGNLSPAEVHVFTRTHTFQRGKRAGETVKSGLVYREEDRFFRYSKFRETP